MHSQDGSSRILRRVWGLAPLSTRGPQARYDVSDIAGSAVSLADARGLPGVSLAAIAADLGLTTTALYRYVESKDELLELMVDAAVGPPPALHGDDWKARVHVWARQLWLRYTAHPWLADVRAPGMPRYPNRLAWVDQLLRELDHASIADPMHSALLLDSIARTFSLLSGPSQLTAPVPDWLLDAAATRFPRLARELTRDWTNLDDEFTTAVDTLLQGAEARTASAP
jgi:AcrR family transcriptional regulator